MGDHTSTMTTIHGVSRVSIGQGATFNTVGGNQTNNTYNTFNQTVEQQKERTIYDEFHDIKSGSVCRLRNVDRSECWDWWDWRKLRAVRTISTAEICGERESLRDRKFTVVSYEGSEAEVVWERDFEQVSRYRDAMKMQLFGVNRSSIPLLIFHGELLPMAHFESGLGPWGEMYIFTLAAHTMNCMESELWVDPERGTIVQGLEGPGFKNPPLPIFPDFPTLPSNAELFLQEEVSFRFFSQLPLYKELDRWVIGRLLRTSIIHTILPFSLHPPCVHSGLTNSIIAVGNGEWKDLFGALQSPVTMPDGRTRFTLTRYLYSPYLNLVYGTLEDEFTWLAQASSIFHKHGISLDEDLRNYSYITPYIELKGKFDLSAINRTLRSENSPIYFFLDPPDLFPQLERDLSVSVHTWSRDPNGQTSFSNRRCRYLSLPTELKVQTAKMREVSWPSETYNTIYKWQMAKGFDPKTTDFVRYLGYPVWEVMQPGSGLRFEELYTDPLEPSNSNEDAGLCASLSEQDGSLQDDEGQTEVWNCHEEAMNLNESPGSTLAPVFNHSQDVGSTFGSFPSQTEDFDTFIDTDLSARWEMMKID